VGETIENPRAGVGQQRKGQRAAKPRNGKSNGNENGNLKEKGKHKIARRRFQASRGSCRCSMVVVVWWSPFVVMLTELEGRSERSSDETQGALSLLLSLCLDSFALSSTLRAHRPAGSLTSHQPLTCYPGGVCAFLVSARQFCQPSYQIF
jgi:hypothetical protein